MDFTLIADNHKVASPTATSFRVCVGLPSQLPLRGRPPRGLTGSGCFLAEDAGGPATYGIALRHLRWHRVPTPFVSAFASYERALGWAGFLQRQGHREVYIVVIDTYTVTDGHLWDAHSIARRLGLVGQRLQYRKNEYLFLNTIPAERILAVVPAMGVQVPLYVRLGKLTLPESYLEMLPSRTIEAIKQDLMEEIYRHHGVKDEVRLLQTIHALCTERWD
jgi:hypothetical protein